MKRLKSWAVRIKRWFWDRPNYAEGSGGYGGNGGGGNGGG
jgi:hypothetical protein